MSKNFIIDLQTLLISFCYFSMFMQVPSVVFKISCTVHRNNYTPFDFTTLSPFF